MRVANPIKDTFFSVMKAAGFQKKSNCWYRRGEDLLQVTNLQKSDWGDQYYVNLAWWIEAFGPGFFPKEHHCQVRHRASLLEKGQQRYWERTVFNLKDTSLTEAERAKELTRFLDELVMPYLDSCNSKASLRAAYKAGRLLGADICGVAQTMLDATSSS